MLVIDIFVLASVLLKWLINFMTQAVCWRFSSLCWFSLKGLHLWDSSLSFIPHCLPQHWESSKHTFSCKMAGVILNSGVVMRLLTEEKCFHHGIPAANANWTFPTAASCWKCAIGKRVDGLILSAQFGWLRCKQIHQLLNSCYISDRVAAKGMFATQVVMSFPTDFRWPVVKCTCCYNQ